MFFTPSMVVGFKSYSRLKISHSVRLLLCFGCDKHLQGSDFKVVPLLLRSSTN